MISNFTRTIMQFFVLGKKKLTYKINKNRHSTFELLFLHSNLFYYLMLLFVDFINNSFSCRFEFKVNHHP